MTIIETVKPPEPCPQCAANARTNEAGGHPDLAAECLAYCRDDHRANGPAVAQTRLVRAGAQFVEEALANNPDGPVQMVTTVGVVDVDYEVVIGNVYAGDRGRARTIWHKSVVFGMTDRTVAGGAAFCEAARTQEAVAHAALTLLESRR